MPQKIRVPRSPSGRKVINMVPPIKRTNMSTGVRKPQIGHIEKIRLNAIKVLCLPEEADKSKDGNDWDELRMLFFKVDIISFGYKRKIEGQIDHHTKIDTKSQH
jgi:hypothetical protein